MTEILWVYNRLSVGMHPIERVLTASESHGAHRYHGVALTQA